MVGFSRSAVTARNAENVTIQNFYARSFDPTAIPVKLSDRIVGTLLFVEGSILGSAVFRLVIGAISRSPSALLLQSLQSGAGDDGITAP